MAGSERRGWASLPQAQPLPDHLFEELTDMASVKDAVAAETLRPTPEPWLFFPFQLESDDGPVFAVLVAVLTPVGVGFAGFVCQQKSERDALAAGIRQGLLLACPALALAEMTPEGLVS